MMDRADFEPTGGPPPATAVRDGTSTGEARDTLSDSGLRLITLDLARCADYPIGSVRHGYSFVAPLTADGHLDAGAWHEQRHRCYVRRFWAGEPDRIGRLVHRRGGSGGATWCFEYNDVIGTEAEAGHHLQQHCFVPGEYVSVLQDDEELKTFKVADVRKVCAR
jgi:hypothetical protein